MRAHHSILMLPLLLTLASGSPGFADDKEAPLKGRVHKAETGSKLLPRPLRDSLQKTSFTLGTNKDDWPATQNVPGTNEEPKFSLSTKQTNTPSSGNNPADQQVWSSAKPKSDGHGPAMTPFPVPAQETGKQLIIVRLVYHQLDQPNVFHAMKMINALKAADPSSDVVLMLDKEATTIANRHSSTQYIERGEPAAKSLAKELHSFITGGGRVVASKEWADDYGINDGNINAGVELMSTDEFAQLIVKASKILEY